jgi:hypothetical protein
VGGRRAVGNLAETGGREWEEGSGKTEHYKPGFLKLHARGKGEELKDRGNVLTFIREDRREVVMGVARPARELGRLVEKKVGSEGGIGRNEKEAERLETFGKGVSIEAEYAFTKAVGEYCKEAVREGTFRGSYVLNLKEQMECRMEDVLTEGERVRVLLVGGSQMGRLGREMERKGGEAVEVCGWVKVRGHLDEDEGVRGLGEGHGMVEGIDKVVIGGPGNSLVSHGRGEERGFCPERTVQVGKGRDGNVTGVRVRYHLTEPERVKRDEKLELMRNVSTLVRGMMELSQRYDGVEPELTLVYIVQLHVDVPPSCDRKRVCCDGGRHLYGEWV